MAGRTILNGGRVIIDRPFFVNVCDKMYGNGEYHYGPRLLHRSKLYDYEQNTYLRIAYRIKVTMKLDINGRN